MIRKNECQFFLLMLCIIPLYNCKPIYYGKAKLHDELPSIIHLYKFEDNLAISTDIFDVKEGKWKFFDGTFHREIQDSNIYIRKFVLDDLYTFNSFQKDVKSARLKVNVDAREFFSEYNYSFLVADSLIPYRGSCTDSIILPPIQDSIEICLITRSSRDVIGRGYVYESTDSISFYNYTNFALKYADIDTTERIYFQMLDKKRATLTYKCKLYEFKLKKHYSKKFKRETPIMPIWLEN